MHGRYLCRMGLVFTEIPYFLKVCSDHFTFRKDLHEHYFANQKIKEEKFHFYEKRQNSTFKVCFAVSY